MKKDLNNRADTPCSWSDGKRARLLWVIYRENAIPIKTPTGLFIELANIIIKAIRIKTREEQQQGRTDGTVFSSIL